MLDQDKFEQMKKEWESFKGTLIYKELLAEKIRRKEEVWDRKIDSELAKIDREREIGYVNCLDWLLTHFDEYLEEEVVLQEQEKAKVLEEKEKQRLAKLRRGV